MDRLIAARRPDVVVIDKHTSQMVLTNVSIPADKTSQLKKNKRFPNNRTLLDLERLWNTKTKIVPFIVGAHISKRLEVL